MNTSIKSAQGFLVGCLDSKSINLVFAAIVLLGLLSKADGVCANESKRPDIVFILLDDLRYDALSFLGHPYVRTPHIDKLRSQGAWIENCFVTTSICCPSRATFLTGCYASRHGVIDNETSEYNEAVTPPVTKYLQDAGYKTAMIGKWHMGHSGKPRPTFDQWISFDGQGVYNDPTLNINGQEVKEAGYTTDILTDHAIKFIDSQSLDSPYFLMLSHKAVHEPFEPALRHKDDFGKDRGLPEPESWKDDFRGKPAWQIRERTKDVRWDYRTRELEIEELPESVEPEPWDPKQRYVNQLRCLSAVDEGVGKIIKKLEDRGTLENTIIVFTSDNGYFHLEHRRWDKRLAYDESLRIPMVIVYSGQISAGSTIKGLCTNADLAPTLLDLAKLNVPEDMQGSSIRPLLNAQDSEWREHVFYEYWTELVHAIPTMTAVRTAKMKLIRYPTLNDIDELYDLENDSAELVNLVNDPAYADEYARLEQLLNKSQLEIGWKPRIFPKNLPRMRGEAETLLDLRVSDGKLIDIGKLVEAKRVQANQNGTWAIQNNAPIVFKFDKNRDPSSWPFVVDLSFQIGSDGVILSTSGLDSGFAIFVEDGRPAVTTRVKTWITTTTTIDGPKLVKGEWADVQVRVDYNQLVLTVNDKVIETISLPLPFKTPTNKPLRIGIPSKLKASKDTPSDPFLGNIRRLKIYRPDVSENVETTVTTVK